MDSILGKRFNPVDAFTGEADVFIEVTVVEEKTKENGDVVVRLSNGEGRRVIDGCPIGYEEA